jgi:ribosomal 50S subunit-recycling heat shock protein
MSENGSEPAVRLDLFLALARLIKRRTIARKTCEQGLVLVNGFKAKAGRKVVRGDLITIVFPRKKVTIRVLNPVKRGARTEEVFQFISEEERKEV